MNYNVTVIPGDGIGPEIVREARKVLDQVGKVFGHSFDYTEILMGGCSIDAYGVPLTEEALETGRNRALLYWAFISNREDGQSAGQKYRTFRETVNRRIREGESGLPPITSVSVADIKKLIHQDPQVAGRYPWLEAALKHPEG